MNEDVKQIIFSIVSVIVVCLLGYMAGLDAGEEIQKEHREPACTNPR